MLNELWMLIAAVGAGVVAILGYGWGQKRKGKEELRNENLRNTQERLQEGRDHLRANRDDDPDERVRRNDGRW